MIHRLLAFATLPLFTLASLKAQTPTPTPVPTPSPTPDALPVDPLPTPAATPTPTPAPVVADADGNIIADPTPDPDLNLASDDELSLPADFADPGDPPPYVPNIEPNLNEIAPSPATIRRMNDEAIAKINAFAQSQRNPSVPNLTLDEAIQTALKQNPDILNAIQQIRLTRGQVIEVQAQALPQLGVTAAYTQQQRTLVDPKQPSRGGGGLDSATLTLPDGQQATLDFGDGGDGGFDFYVNDKSYDIQLQASQLIYNGGGTLAGIRSAKFVEDSAYFSLRQTIDQTISSVKTAFYQVILNRALVVAQQQSVNLLEEQLVDQQNRFEAGTIPRFNVLQAEVALSNAKPPLIQALNNLRIAQYQLVVLLGVDYSAANPSEVPFNVMGALPFRPRAINADESIRVAIERSPLLKAQRRNILAQAQNVKVAFSGYYPTLEATGGYIVRNNTAFQNLGEITQGWTAGIQGSWAIFDGFETAGQTAQARAALEQAAIAYDNSVRQVILDVQQAISNLQTARETLESQQQNVVQGTEALRLSQERLDAGAGTQLDVLNAQVALLQAQTTVLQARYDYLAALAQYDLALSLDAQYAEFFDDPLARNERVKFETITEPTAPQPSLPEGYDESDPIKGLAANAPGATPTPIPKTIVIEPPPKRSRGGKAFVPGRR
ncbi:MAG: TolC family protein [Chthoniobacterales bacterium]